MTATKTAARRLQIPDTENATVRPGRHEVQLTNLGKTFWPELGLTKRDLLQYYADVSSVLLPHVKDRAMVMKRYPNGIHGKCFFMKRTPCSHPGDASPWSMCCEPSSGCANLSQNSVMARTAPTRPHLQC